MVTGLAQMARGFEPSEQEFRTIFQTEKQFGRDDYGWVEGTTGYGAAETSRRRSRNSDFKSALQQALGAERYASISGAWIQTTSSFTTSPGTMDCPKTTILKAYELNRAAEQQAAALRSDVLLSAENRQAALRQLQEQTDQDVAKLLREWES